MKRLIFIGGTMGVGKTAVCRELQRTLPGNVFLDGDWCWDAAPFVVNAETKAMVLDNICYLLQNFLDCSAYENVIFCWVMHQEEIVRQILSELRGTFPVFVFPGPVRPRRSGNGWRGISAPVFGNRMCWSGALRGWSCIPRWARGWWTPQVCRLAVSQRCWRSVWKKDTG